LSARISIHSFLCTARKDALAKLFWSCRLTRLHPGGVGLADALQDFLVFMTSASLHFDSVADPAPRKDNGSPPVIAAYFRSFIRMRRTR
jgi:hypothetical protein